MISGALLFATFLSPFFFFSMFFLTLNFISKKFFNSKEEGSRKTLITTCKYILFIYLMFVGSGLLADILMMK